MAFFLSPFPLQLPKLLSQYYGPIYDVKSVTCPSEVPYMWNRAGLLDKEEVADFCFNI